MEKSEWHKGKFFRKYYKYNAETKEREVGESVLTDGYQLKNRVAVVHDRSAYKNGWQVLHITTGYWMRTFKNLKMAKTFGQICIEVMSEKFWLLDVPNASEFSTEWKKVHDIFRECYPQE